MSIATLVPPGQPSHRPEPSDLGFGPLPATATPVPLRRLPLPVLEPRDAVPVVDPAPRVTAEQQALDLGQASARSGSALPGASGAARRSSGAADTSAEARSAQRWAFRFVQAAVEVAVGVRPSGQLVRWTHPEVQLLLERRAGLATRLSRRSGVSSGGGSARVVVRLVRVCPVRPGVHEVTAVVQDRDRTRAVALRVELFEGRWRATALELG